MGLIINPKYSHADNLSQEQKKFFKTMEDSLIHSADSMFYTLIPDFRKEFCEQFVRQLVRTLKMPNSYEYPFDSLRKKINIISPEDQSFRIFNWPLAYTDVRLKYYAAIQMRSEQLKLYPLFDHSDVLSSIDQDSVHSAQNWIGGLFYNIITKEVDQQTVYCLLGVNDGNPMSTKKFIDPLIFTSKGPEFGAPIFSIASDTRPQQNIYRFILEYKKGVQVGLNWDNEKKAILFDDIASQINDPKRKYTYIPTGLYNGLVWNVNHWVLKNNVIPVLELKDGDAPEANKKSKK